MGAAIGAVVERVILVGCGHGDHVRIGRRDRAAEIRTLICRPPNQHRALLARLFIAELQHRIVWTGEASC